ncbi:MAG: ribonuclease Z [Ilumatobacteraceae bacterium]|nr:ribonuclease Z [Ilumatobacteraceae bacterium]MBL6759528.1 ribonuclease Z [Ilumatobacteraceae bacterium]
MMRVVTLGTGSPLPDPNRAGPSTLVSVDDQHLLIDCGRGVLMRLAAAGVGAAQLSAVLITHLHSDHLTDLNDVITTRWISTFESTPLTVVGPPGTQAVVDSIESMLRADTGYRLAHHDDLTEAPITEVIELTEGPVELPGGPRITAAPTDHRPVEPSVAYRIEHDGRAVVLAGDTVPCTGLDSLARGADILVHTAIRADVIANIPIARLNDVCDYHSSIEQAADTAERAGVGVLVLTHHVPAHPPGQGDEVAAIASRNFSGRVVVADDLTTVTIPEEH